MYLRDHGDTSVQRADLDALETATGAIEVQVFWQDTLLQVCHLSPPRPFVLADSDDADFRLDAELLDGDMMQVPAEPGTYDAGTLTLVVREVNAAKPVPRGPLTVDWRRHAWTLGSFAVHGIFLLMVALVPPNASALSVQRLSLDDRYTGFDYLIPAVVDAPDPILDPRDEGGGEPAEAAPGDPGQSGDRHAQPAPKRRTFRGDEDAPKLSREEALAMAQNAGLIGILRAQTAPGTRSPYAAALAAGSDPETALGQLLGDQVGSAFGFGGLHMLGTGRGGQHGIRGTIGVGKLGTRGHCVGTDCAGYGPGTGPGVGRGGPSGLGTRTARVPPKVSSDGALVKGALSKETIRRVIGRQLKQVRFCYEQGLQTRPDLEGRVAVKFIIDPTGAVKLAMVSDATLGAPAVAQCISNVIQRLTFPAPGGVVSVTYPFTLRAAGM